MNVQPILGSIRKSKKMRQIEVAEKLGISQTYLSQIETCKRTPSISIIERYCDILDVSLCIDGMGLTWVLKEAVKAAFRSPKFLQPRTLRGKVRIPFIPADAIVLPDRVNHYCLVYNPESEELDAVECPDGRVILLN